MTFRCTCGNEINVNDDYQLSYTQTWNEIAEFEERTSKSWDNADSIHWEANRSAKMEAYVKLAEIMADGMPKSRIVVCSKCGLVFEGIHRIKLALQNKSSVTERRES